MPGPGPWPVVSQLTRLIVDFYRQKVPQTKRLSPHTIQFVAALTVTWKISLCSFGGRITKRNRKEKMYIGDFRVRRGSTDIVHHIGSSCFAFSHQNLCSPDGDVSRPN